MAVLLTLIALAACASSAEAQARHRVFTLEVSPVGGALSYARGQSADRLTGIELGLRTPELDRTLEPAQDPATGSPRFEEFLHVAVFARFRPSARFEVDGGLRGSVASLWECTASDCWPALFGGVYVQPMVGWRRVKLGARVGAGWIREVPEGRPDGYTPAVWMTPFLVRFSFGG